MRRWFKKLATPAAVLALGGLVIFFAHEVYSAWTLKSITLYGRLATLFNARVVTSDANPVAFWCVFAFFVFWLVVGLAFAVLAVFDQRRMNKLWRRRQTRPALDDGIRQSAADR